MLITSLHNPRIKQVIALQERRERDRTGLTRVEGYDEIRLALASGVRPVALFVCTDLVRDALQKDLLDKIRRSGVEIIEVSERVFDRIAYREGADGWLATFPTPGHRLADVRLGDPPFVIVVEAIEKPGNLGAILRSADAAGVDVVISADSVTDWGNPNVVRASKGALFAVAIAQAKSDQIIAWLRERSIRIVVTTPRATASYIDGNFSGPVAIVLGSEKHGVSQVWLAHADATVRIPMFGRVNSLNVSTAAALVAYEVVRQRHSED